ncbi:hypothetical protein GV790_30330, partial [Nocardia cyriacigeorgica]|nr:hypothetical protein [Nocardia cyriacigeorgica]
VGHPQHQREVDLLADELTAASTAVTDLWGQDWSRSPVVVVPARAARSGATTESGSSSSAAQVPVSSITMTVVRQNSKRRRCDSQSRTR